MSVEIWIVIILLIIIVCFIFTNKSKKEQIDSLVENHKREIDKFDNEILSLKNAVENGNIALLNTLKVNTEATAELQTEIAKQMDMAQNKFNTLNQKYITLMRAYMLARKKSEVEIIDEIEKSISDDYEQLGSQTMPASSYIASAMADFYTLQIKGAEKELSWMGQQSRSTKIADLRKDAALIIERAKNCQYTLEAALAHLIEDNPKINADYIEKHYGISLSTASSDTRYDEAKISNYIQQISSLSARCRELEEEVDSFKNYKDIRWPLLRESVADYQKKYASNLTAIPYMSRIVADIMTVDLDRLAWSLSWGNNKVRKQKVASLNALKKEKANEIEQIKGAEYQLAYLLELYPVLQDVIDTEFKDLDISYEQIEDCDPTRSYIEREEWEKLTEVERNQLALDRYIESRKKSKWQIGRDFELYCGYCYEKKGFIVDYFGSYNGLEDLGRDLIVKRGNDIRIVQCKYWSNSKQIHEKHIMQLYGSVVLYNLKNSQNATGILITNIELSNKAKEIAQALGISYRENMPLGKFPRIKCNIGVGEFGEKTKIYHLPFDQQYDATKIDGNGESMAMTVAEAERAGFRRAYKWHGIE